MHSQAVDSKVPSAREGVDPILRFEDLKALGIFRNRMSLGRAIKAGQFPAPIRLGPNSVGWFASEIRQWQAALPRAAAAASQQAA